MASPGTTPTVEFTIDRDWADAESVRLTIADRSGRVALTKTGRDFEDGMVYEEGETRFSVRFSQRETMQFGDDETVRLQCRAFWPNEEHGDYDSDATDVVSLTWGRLLERGFVYDG